MEKDNNTVCEADTKEPNVRVYEIKGCTFKVRREFEQGGTTILEQIISLLLDIMEKQEQEDKTWILKINF